MSELFTAADYSRRVSELSATYQLFSQLDVIDIEFTSGHQWEVYASMTPESHQHGLRGLRSLEGIDGMLFCFAEESAVVFTMQGMSMGLDIAWFSASGKLLQNGTFEADHKYPLLCERPFSYVLESSPGSFGPTDLRVSNG